MTDPLSSTTKTTRRILVALDNSEVAPQVLDYAIELAAAAPASEDARVRLLRVVLAMPPRLTPPVANIFEPAGDTNALVAMAEADLMHHEGAVPMDRRDGVVVVVGEPGTTICAMAKAYDADLVVMGAHRYGMLDRALGTTAAKVVNHIDRPVVIVRPKAPAVAVTSSSSSARKHSSSSRPSAAAEAASKDSNNTVLPTATIAGAIAGAVVGAAAGPPGVIAGGIVGTAIGLIAGSTLQSEAHRRDKHDHELDDVIGVTAGDLGAREAASASLTKLEQQERQGGAVDNDGGGGGGGGGLQLSSIAKQLRAEHQRLERAYAAFLDAYRTGNWEAVREQWVTFEPALRQHMTTEENDMFATFRATAPADAAILLAEHVELRRMLDVLGVAIDLHAVPERDAEELVMRLREHGAREEKILYPWLGVEAPMPAQNAQQQSQEQAQ